MRLFPFLVSLWSLSTHVEGVLLHYLLRIDPPGGCPSSGNGVLNIGGDIPVPMVGLGIKIHQVAFAMRGTSFSIPSTFKLTVGGTSANVAGSTTQRCCSSTNCDLAVYTTNQGNTWYNGAVCGQVPGCSPALNWRFLDYTNTPVGTCNGCGVSGSGSISIDFSFGGSALEIGNYGSGTTMYISYEAILPILTSSSARSNSALPIVALTPSFYRTTESSSVSESGSPYRSIVPLTPSMFLTHSSLDTWSSLHTWSAVPIWSRVATGTSLKTIEPIPTKSSSATKWPLPTETASSFVAWFLTSSGHASLTNADAQISFYETKTAIPISSKRSQETASAVPSASIPESISGIPTKSYTSSHLSRMESIQSITSQFLNTSAIGGESSKTDPIGMILGGTSVGVVGLGVAYILLQQLKKRGINPLILLQVASTMCKKENAPSDSDDSTTKKTQRKQAFEEEEMTSVIPVLSSTPPRFNVKEKACCPHCGKKPLDIVKGKAKAKAKEKEKKTVDVKPPQAINDSIYKEMEEGNVEEPVQFPYKKMEEEIVDLEEVDMETEEDSIQEKSKTVIEIEKDSLEQVVKLLETMKKKYSVIEI